MSGYRDFQKNYSPKMTDKFERSGKLIVVDSTMKGLASCCVACIFLHACSFLTFCLHDLTQLEDKILLRPPVSMKQEMIS